MSISIVVVYLCAGSPKGCLFWKSALAIIVSRLDLSEQTNDQREMRNPQFTSNHLKTVGGNWYDTELAICILENTPKLEMLLL